MSGIYQDLQVDGLPTVRLESDFLRVDVAPGVGGRVISLLDKSSGHEFLWRNRALPLELKPAGAEYDPNFFGGIDELLPNDIPESIDGVACPDHGELWTTPLVPQINDQRLSLRGKLPGFGLSYEREMALRQDAPCLEFNYRLTNLAREPRHFLWKLHAAVAVEPGDRIICPARRGQVVDLAWSRYKTLAPFDWPNIAHQRADLIPAPDGTVDFFYLFDLPAGEIACQSSTRGLTLGYRFDPKVFPYAWLFASYGGFNGHYVVVLEPCTAMPISVREATAQGHCSRLAPGETLATTVTLYAGPSSGWLGGARL